MGKKDPRTKGRRMGQPDHDDHDRKPPVPHTTPPLSLAPISQPPPPPSPSLDDDNNKKAKEPNEGGLSHAPSIDPYESRMPRPGAYREGNHDDDEDNDDNDTEQGEEKPPENMIQATLVPEPTPNHTVIQEARIVSFSETLKRKEILIPFCILILLMIIGIVVAVLVSRQQGGFIGSSNSTVVTLQPSASPSMSPTGTPSVPPTEIPSPAPSELPTFVPTPSPSDMPSFTPSFVPTGTPSTGAPTGTPSAFPTPIPTTASPTQPFWQQVGPDFEGLVAGERSGSCVAMSSNGFTVAVGGQRYDDGAQDIGILRVFRYDRFSAIWRPWGQALFGTQPFDLFGAGCALSDDGLTVASLASQSRSSGPLGLGYVQVFTLEFMTETVSFNWTQLGQTLIGGSGGDKDSLSLSSDGRTVAIGSVVNGTVRVYDLDSGNWTLVGQELMGDMVGGDAFGGALELSSDGSILAVGASSAGDGDQGNARVFRFDSLTMLWQPIGQTINGTARGDEAGWAVALSNNGMTLAVGTIGSDESGRPNAGQVIVYTFSSGMWEPLGDPIFGEAADDNFGFAVSLSGDGRIVAIGAPGNVGLPGDTVVGFNAGHVRIFGYSSTGGMNGVWTQFGVDVDGLGQGDASGYDVALSDDGLFLVVGSPLSNRDSLRDVGHARVFEWPY